MLWIANARHSIHPQTHRNAYLMHIKNIFVIYLQQQKAILEEKKIKRMWKVVIEMILMMAKVWNILSTDRKSCVSQWVFSGYFLGIVMDWTPRHNYIMLASIYIFINWNSSTTSYGHNILIWSYFFYEVLLPGDWKNIEKVRKIAKDFQ